MSKLKVDTKQALDQLQKRISAGDALMAKPISISHPKDLVDLIAESEAWSGLNDVILKRLYSDDSVFNEYWMATQTAIAEAKQANDGQLEMERRFIKAGIRVLEKYAGAVKLEMELMANVVPAAKMIQMTRNVFIVHGHDGAIKESVARFLTQLDLKPIILHEQPNGGRTVIEKFEASADVSFAVVIMTPDDQANVVSTPTDKEFRARQNVVFELGYFIGRLGRKHVAALKEASVAVPSDISGVVYINLDAAGAWKLSLAKEIKNAGIDVDMNKAV